jgi:hypothetical protein
MNKEEYETVVCVECGKQSTASYVEPIRSRMINKSLCFYCDFWSEYVDRKSDPNITRIKGVHYYIEPDVSYKSGAGFGGREFIIDFFDGRHIVTHNLWYQGEIPDHFLSRLPDNARWGIKT